jgi:hypothetical protein
MMVPALTVVAWLLAQPVVPVADVDAEDTAAEDAALATAERVPPKLISPAMVAAAESFLDLPLGTERFAWVEGKRYVFVLERHYHPPGTPGKPSGFHKGVTMYELR